MTANERGRIEVRLAAARKANDDLDLRAPVESVGARRRESRSRAIIMSLMRLAPSHRHH
jgi:hypothetical protein